ncbi:YfhO family protein [candidate division KSB1 bacterium]|nr:YfhO family protein [candidate division KSB1 bacterium]
MAKKKKPAKQTAGSEPTPRARLTDHPVAIAGALALILLLIFFYPVIWGGKTFTSPDQMTANASIPFAEDALERGIYPQWTPYIFSGMPSYASLLRKPRINLIDSSIQWVLQQFDLIFPNPHFMFLFLNYLLLALAMYALLRNYKLGPPAAIFAGLTVIFLPQFIAFTAYGHNSKFISVALIPLILLFAHNLINKRNALYFALTTLTIALQLMRSHVQVIYYTFLLLGIFWLFELIASRKDSGEIRAVIGGGALVAAAVGISFLLTAVLYLPVLEYQHYSIRGGEGRGLSFDYASSWSFHPLEIVTFLFPSFMGFGGETYWGKMPFTDYPLYFGVVVLLLAGMAFVLRRNRTTWFFGVMALFSLVVSFGKHAPLLYTPMFKFFPFFNKFRVPSMIHILLDIAMIALAAIGLQALIDHVEKIRPQRKIDPTKKKLATYFGIFLGFVGLMALFLLFGKSSYLSLVTSSRANLTVAHRLSAYEAALGDAFKALLLVSAAVALLLAFLRSRLNKWVLTLALTALVLIDFFPIDLKISRRQASRENETYFAPTPAVELIKQDPEIFRVFPVLDRENSNWYMYHFIQSTGGYSAAKVRIYQDFLEETGFSAQFNAFLAKYWRYGLRDNKPQWTPLPLEQIPQQRLKFDYAMLDMLNVKYLIVNHLPLNDGRYRQVAEFGNQRVYENTSRLPRVFFVDRIEQLQGQQQIFQRMKRGDFNPHTTAILEKQPPFSISTADSNRATITHYDIQQIRIQASVKAPTLMVLSEIYYPAGWHAMVNGQSAEIYKTNYLLRSLFLQPGEHEIVFYYRSAAFALGKWISIVTLVLILGLLLAVFILRWTNKTRRQSAA